MNEFRKQLRRVLDRQSTDRESPVRAIARSAVVKFLVRVDESAQDALTAQIVDNALDILSGATKEMKAQLRAESDAGRAEKARQEYYDESREE